MPGAVLNTVDSAGQREGFCPKRVTIRGAGIRLFKL